MASSNEIFVLDDDPSLGDVFAQWLETDGYRVSAFRDEAAFESVARLRTPACVLLDLYLPRRSGLEILKDLDARNYPAPIVIISGRASIPLAVEATRNGAFDVFEKPFAPETLARRVRETIEAWERQERATAIEALVSDFPGSRRLTPREHEVLAEIAAASSNKEAAAHLGLSPRTVEVHRAHIMMKLGTKNTADLVRLVMRSGKTN